MEEKILFGLIILICCLLVLPLQLLTFPVFILYSEYRSVMCFRIMLSISILDTAQILAHALAGLGMIFNWHFEGALEKIIGSILFAAFMAAVMQHLILAINRLLVVLQMEAEKFDFINNLVLYSLLAVSWLWASLFFAINLTSFSGIIFYVSTNYTFDYSEKLPWSNTVAEVDFYSTIPSPVIGLCIYAFIIFKLVLKRKKYIIPTIVKNKQSNKFLTKSEVKLMIQALMSYAFTGVIFTFYHICDIFGIPGPTFSLFFTLFWICFSCVSPVLCLTMNSVCTERSLHKLKCLFTHQPNQVDVQNVRMQKHLNL